MNSDAPTTPESTRSPSVVAPAPIPTAGARTYDDDLVAFGEMVPGGFGGMYQDGSGAVVLYLVDETRSEDAVEAVFGLLSTTDPSLTRERIRVRTAQFTFADLLAFYRALLTRAESRHIRTGDVHDVDNIVRVTVVDVAASEAVRNAILDLGLPTAAFDLVIHPAPAYDTTLQDRVRPVMGGLQQQFSPSPTDICTISFNVEHWQFGRTLVTNSHCSIIQGGLDATLLHQATWGSPNRIATEVLDPPWVSGPGCPVGSMCRLSDAALFVYDDSVSWDFAKVARTTQLVSVPKRGFFE